MVAYCLELQMLFLMKSFWKAKFWMRWKHKLSYKCRWLQCSMCFKALHNRANTDIYKVLQIIGKSISLELVYLKVSSSESKICKRCLRWFICSRNTNLPETVLTVLCILWDAKPDCTRIVHNFLWTILVHLFLKMSFSEYTI